MKEALHIEQNNVIVNVLKGRSEFLESFITYTVQNYRSGKTTIISVLETFFFGAPDVEMGA